MKKGQAGNLRNLVLFSQLGLSVISPILVMGLLAYYLRRREGAPVWLAVLLVSVGLISGLCSAWKLIGHMIKAGAESDLDPAVFRSADAVKEERESGQDEEKKTEDVNE